MPKLIIISNRLPVSVKKESGKLKLYPSTGGLVNGLANYMKRPGTKWIGWPGLASDDLSEDERAKIQKILKPHRCYPVFLTHKQIDEYYNGYSNSVLWPLLHDLPVESGNNQRNWQSYHRVNELFSAATVALSKPDSTIWVHDYHLMLLPGMLRRELPNTHIGFFLHIPLPLSAKLEDQPHIRSLVAGTLGADLIGFHTQSYTENFLNCCAKLGIGERSDNQIVLSSRSSQIVSLPMGIDYAKFASASKTDKVRLEYLRLQRKYAGQKVIVTVDRLDPTKGFIERLKAFQKVLKTQPELHGKIVMVMLAIPSRSEIAAYQKLRKNVEVLVGEINQEFGSKRWQPIEYLFRTMPFAELSALYRRADVAFVAPIKDGMNLVAKEYVASQQNQAGVLILSKSAGAAEELTGAVQVDPKSMPDLVAALKSSLSAARTDRLRRIVRMQQHLKVFTAQKWAQDFIEALQKPRTMRRLNAWMINAQIAEQITSAYHSARRRLLLLDYDGTLREFENDPTAATPSPEILQLLKRLGKEKNTDVMLISGRNEQNLEDWFGDLPIALAAEHGALVRRGGGKSWHVTSTADLAWRPAVKKLFDKYARITPGAFTEQKSWSSAWHYRSARPYQGRKSLVTLRRRLKPYLQKHNLEIIEGDKILEVRPKNISKRRAVQEWLIHDHDFILCIGDDKTDEDMFAALPPQAYSIKVGRGQTFARYRAKNVASIIKLLDQLSD